MFKLLDLETFLSVNLKNKTEDCLIIGFETSPIFRALILL